MPAYYSFNWATGVVETMLRKYPRGAKTALRILHLTPRNLACYLANKYPLWPKLRRIVRFCDQMETVNKQHYTDVQLIEYLQSITYYSSENRLCKYLDKRLKQITLEEQA